jgi:hypothetical protein
MSPDVRSAQWRAIMSLRLTSLLLPLLLLLGACGTTDPDSTKPIRYDNRERIRAQAGTIHGNPKGFVLYGGKDDGRRQENGDAGEAAATGAGGGYLWQAALDSLDFMPLAQADATGGVIITDWYAPPETPDERFKINVFVQGQEIRADAVKVRVFRQVRQDDGWTDAAVDPKTPVELEDNILRRARELRPAG